MNKYYIHLYLRDGSDLVTELSRDTWTRMIDTLHDNEDFVFWWWDVNNEHHILRTGDVIYTYAYMREPTPTSPAPTDDTGSGEE